MTRGLPPGPRWQRRAERRWLDDIGGLLLECRERYGDVFTLPVPGLHGPRSTRAVIAGNPGEVYDLLRAGSELNTAGDCRERVIRFAGPQSIFIVEGARHIHRRRLMLPRFHRRSVERLGGLIHEIVDAEIDSWPLDEPFALAKGLSAMTFGVLVRVVFGPVDPEWQARLGRGVRSAAQPWDGPRVVERSDPEERRELDDLLYERIALHRAGEVRTEGDDFLSVFLEATDEDGAPLDDAQVHDELLSLLLAGHDSVAITLTWALDHILRDSALIATLREEAEAGESARIDAVVTEILRLHPPLPLVARTLAVPATVGGYELDAGTVVVPCIWLAQRSPDSFPDPHEFEPERFLGAGAQPQEWMAFGAGTRRCLGAVFADYQLRHVLQRILTRTSLDVLGEQSRYGSWRMVGLWPGSTRSVLRERRGALTVT